MTIKISGQVTIYSTSIIVFNINSFFIMVSLLSFNNNKHS